MKRVLVALTVTILAALTATAWADSFVDPIISDLKANRVSIDIRSPNVTADTQGILTDELNDGDKILIAVIPDNPEVQAAALARQIDAGTGRSHIIAVSEGDTVVATSSILPAGVAADLMHRAASVSSTNVETLTTFIANVHDWQTANPKAAASRSVTKKHSGSSVGTWLLIVLGGLFLLCVLAAFYAWWVNDKPLFGGGSNEDVRFKSPQPVRDPLEFLFKMRDQVQDQKVRVALVQICRDTEAYFQRCADSKGADAAEFHTHLITLGNVLKRYIDIQNNPRYYDDAAQLLTEGVTAFEGFAEYVLNSIKRGSRRDRTEFNVDTNILSAKRYA